MHFSDQFLDEVVARNDIADVVSGYVTLTRKGGNLFGLCPFHNEKTPSFSVAPDKQIYHCFGCKKGGGVINFIMEIEGLSFPEAVEFLAGGGRGPQQRRPPAAACAGAEPDSGAVVLRPAAASPGGGGAGVSGQAADTARHRGALRHGRVAGPVGRAAPRHDG